MKYLLTFECSKPLVLPQQYNKILQASLLSWLKDSAYTLFLHDIGYQFEKRTYKLYSFSNLMGRYQIDKNRKKIVFYDNIQLYLSFYTEQSHNLVLNNILNQAPIRFGTHFCHLTHCELVREKNEPCIARTVSPITVHSTLFTQDGKRKTYYYTPQEKEFSPQIRSNLVRKYNSFYGTDPDDMDFSITPLDQKNKEATIVYDHFIIKGYNGRFLIKGSEPMIRMALLAGLGARNGIGMGCIIQEKVLTDTGDPPAFK